MLMIASPKRKRGTVLKKKDAGYLCVVGVGGKREGK